MDFNRAVYGAILQNCADLPANGIYRGARGANGRTDGLQCRRDAGYASSPFSPATRRGNVHSRSRDGDPFARDGTSFDSSNRYRTKWLSRSSGAGNDESLRGDRGARGDGDQPRSVLGRAALPGNAGDAPGTDNLRKLHRRIRGRGRVHPGAGF